MKLSDSERHALLHLARNAIAVWLQGEHPPLPLEHTAGLDRHAGAFVSLHRRSDHALRGCVGSFQSTEPLWKMVREMAVAAAESDNRFPPVSLDELPGLHFEISVLSPRTAIAGPEEVEVGRHGVWLEQGHARGVLLPQVATEAGWDALRLVEGTCRKAGLARDAWREPGTKLFAFEAEVFGEA